MSTDYETYIEKIQRRPGVRLLLLLPPALLVLACLVLIAVSPFAWGAAKIIEAPDWMPPVLGILTALGGLWVGWFAIQTVRRETHGDFSVFSLQTAGGVLFLAIGVAMFLSLAVQLPDSDTYERAIDDEGKIQISPAGFFVTGLILGAIQTGLAWIGAYVYSHAVTNLSPTRLSVRDPNEVDGIGELLRERE